jgi:hypothetical protein
MTDEQEYMLRTVLRNQEVIMNALADLLTGDPRGRIEEQHRERPWRIWAGLTGILDRVQ